MIKYNTNDNCCPKPYPPKPSMPPMPPVPCTTEPELVGILSVCGEPGPRGYSGARLLMKDVTIDDMNGNVVTYTNTVYLDTNSGK